MALCAQLHCTWLDGDDYSLKALKNPSTQMVLQRFTSRLISFAYKSLFNQKAWHCYN